MALSMRARRTAVGSFLVAAVAVAAPALAAPNKGYTVDIDGPRSPGRPSPSPRRSTRPPSSNSARRSSPCRRASRSSPPPPRRARGPTVDDATGVDHASTGSRSRPAAPRTSRSRPRCPCTPADVHVGGHGQAGQRVQRHGQPAAARRRGLHRSRRRSTRRLRRRARRTRAAPAIAEQRPLQGDRHGRRERASEGQLTLAFGSGPADRLRRLRRGAERHGALQRHRRPHEDRARRSSPSATCRAAARRPGDLLRLAGAVHGLRRSRAPTTGTATASPSPSTSACCRTARPPRTTLCVFNRDKLRPSQRRDHPGAAARRRPRDASLIGGAGSATTPSWSSSVARRAALPAGAQPSASSASSVTATS